MLKKDSFSPTGPGAPRRGFTGLRSGVAQRPNVRPRKEFGVAGGNVYAFALRQCRLTVSPARTDVALLIRRAVRLVDPNRHG